MAALSVTAAHYGEVWDGPLTVQQDQLTHPVTLTPVEHEDERFTPRGAEVGVAVTSTT